MGQQSILSRDQTVLHNEYPPAKTEKGTKLYYNKSKKFWILVFALVLLVVLVALGFGLFFGLQSNKNSAASGSFDYSKVTVTTVEVPSLAYPRGIAFDTNGDLIFTDSTDYTVNRLSKSGTVTRIAGSTTGFANGPALQARFNATQALIRGADNNFYVADTYNDRVRKIDMQQNIVSTIAGNGEYKSTDGFLNASSLMTRSFVC